MSAQIKLQSLNFTILDADGFELNTLNLEGIFATIWTASAFGMLNLGITTRTFVHFLYNIIGFSSGISAKLSWSISGWRDWGLGGVIGGWEIGWV